MKPTILARLTIERRNGARLIVEIQADATFIEFYRIYRQDGRKRSTKRLIRTASRNEGLPTINAHRHEPGLEKVAQKLTTFQQESNPATRQSLRIIRKRAYRTALHMDPSALGLTKVSTTFPTFRAMPIPVRIPSTFTPMKKKWSILSSRKIAQEVS